MQINKTASRQTDGIFHEFKFLNSILAPFLRRDFARNELQSVSKLSDTYHEAACGSPDRSFEFNKFSDFSVHMSVVWFGNKFNLFYCETQSRHNFHSWRLLFYELQLIVVVS